MPAFVKLTFFSSNDDVIVNLDDIQTMHPFEGDKGCTITFKNGRKIAVKEPMEKIVMRHLRLQQWWIDGGEMPDVD